MAVADQDVEVVRAVYERWLRDPAALAEAFMTGNREYKGLALDLFDPELEIRQTSAMLDTAGTFHGHEGLLAAGKELHDAFGTIRFVPERWTQEGDCVIVALRMVATGEGSGIEVETKVAHAWRVHDGRVTNMDVYGDESQALDAVRAAR